MSARMSGGLLRERYYHSKKNKLKQPRWFKVTSIYLGQFNSLLVTVIMMLKVPI